MQKINISTVLDCGVPAEEQLPLIKAAGFDGFFLLYEGTEEEPIDLWAKQAEELGLEFETIHGPFIRANELWEAGEIGRNYLEFLKHNIIDVCNRIHVTKLVMHVTVGNTAPSINNEGLALFKELCDYAKEKNVHIAFENLEPLPHIDAVLEHITDSFHGFCWDCGHNACYTPHIDMMKKFGSRLMCLHIHDNYGVTQPGGIDFRDDRHLLPFDGILDWNWFADKIKAAHYEGPITLEVSVKSKQSYKDMPLEDYLAKAYKCACRLRDKINEKK